MAELAVAADMSYKHLHGIEKYSKGASMPTLRKLAQALGVSVKDITRQPQAVDAA